MRLTLLNLLVVCCAAQDFPAPAQTIQERADKTATVTISSPDATILGKVANGVESFNGIPFAEAPTGQLRLRPPKRVENSLGEFDGTRLARACPQMLLSSENENFLFEIAGDLSNHPFFQTVTGQSEDCLSITITRPEGTSQDAKLPVLFWIYGGGFQFGWSSMYDGTGLIKHGLDMRKPFIFVAINYRTSGFGFMPGKEVLADGASNLGLLDQRMALEWVADNIEAFGGDPSLVTLWGESAGAISILNQMALYDGDNTYNGKPLFRGAIMNSGSIIPADPVDCPKGQEVYDKVVKEAGCSGEEDTLNCLREVDYSTFLKAVTSVPAFLSYNSVALSYLPRPDGKVLTESPEILVGSKKYAAVPMIIGDQEDEGTLLAIFQPNLTTTEDLVRYLKDLHFHGASEAQLTELVKTYDEGISAVVNGSPFRTGPLNEVFPGFKRRAALLGDIVFTLSRRAFLTLANLANPATPSWSYLATYNFGTPILGTFHASDIIQVFFGILPNYASRSIRTYYINFLYDLDPNSGINGKYPNWPQWDQGQKLMNFEANRASLINDDFRKDSYEFLLQNVQSLYV
ncbi:hypothetical protein NW760_015375 [Fusarium oxysporum]|nr:hypothetical protein NW769_015358 [Fusarium oxysporum]KAJ4212265.1 hypothetical protein NW760_015375 [Fusarium oxysporum]